MPKIIQDLTSVVPIKIRDPTSTLPAIYHKTQDSTRMRRTVIIMFGALDSAFRLETEDNSKIIDFLKAMKLCNLV